MIFRPVSRSLSQEDTNARLAEETQHLGLVRSTTIESSPSVYRVSVPAWSPKAVPSLSSSSGSPGTKVTSGMAGGLLRQVVHDPVGPGGVGEFLGVPVDLAAVGGGGLADLVAEGAEQAVDVLVA